MGTETAAKERPIVLPEWEVSEIRAGRKTQLRQPMNPQPPKDATEVRVEYPHGKPMVTYRAFPGQGTARWGVEECPYGSPGDRIWLAEDWAARGSHTDRCTSDEISVNPVHFEVWTRSQCFENGRERFNLSFLGRWRRPEEMPIWASRIALEITDVRIEETADSGWDWVIPFNRLEAS